MNDATYDLNSALVDIQRYLLDEIPPLTATEAVQTLMVHPPNLMMKQIGAFALQQGRVQGASVADCLFHALKKVHMISTLKLIEQSSLEAYLNGVIPLALAACPPEDRDALRTNLESLRNSLHFATSMVAVDLGKKAPAAAVEKKSGPLSEIAASAARRFSLVIDRLLRKGQSAPAPAAAIPPPVGVPAEQPVAQLMSMAAESSASEEELNAYVETLKPLAGDKPPGDIISVLAASVPSWEIVAPAATVKPSKSLAAMHKVMSLTKDPSKSATRFRELLMAGIEQFNLGSIGAAASILELAEIIVKEKKIDSATLERIRADALAAVSSDQLKKYAENKAKHPILRKVLGFFPTLRKDSLFAELRGEKKPERRRAVLGLLEAYGIEGREAALAELEKELGRPVEDADTYYLRNLIYLLHRIPRDSDASLQKEFELLTRASAIGQSIYVVKEAVVPLGQIKSDPSVKLLTMRLAEFEAMLLRGKDTTYPVDEVQKLLDRIITALARIGTPAALLTIARHGMKANPILGDTRARMTALSPFDLSFDEQTVSVIVKAIREDLPSGLLGRFIPKKQPPPVRLIEALTNTRSETVDKLLHEIATNYPDDEIGRAAKAAIDNRDVAGRSSATRESATLTGDLQFFGLPAVMQSLAESQATGIVTLIGKTGNLTEGKLLFVRGQFADAQSGHLRGVDALYQMLERPIVGSFAFVSAQPESIKTKNEPKTVIPLLMEGIRRHDELKQAAMIVPDEVALKAAASKPSPVPDEDDPTIIREVWLKASKGGRVCDWESQIPADAYRIRRLVAHWVEEGALQPVA